MTKVVMASVLVLVLGPGPAHTAEPECLMKGYKLEDLATILRGEGYGTVEVVGDDRIRFKAEGSTFLLLLYEDGDLQLYFGLSGPRVGADDINEWNRTKRLARAYIDTEKDPVIEADLLANAGLNQAIVAEFVGTFVKTLVPAYRQFIGERRRAE